jgi:hypothetical protein
VEIKIYLFIKKGEVMFIEEESEMNEYLDDLGFNEVINENELFELEKDNDD